MDPQDPTFHEMPSVFPEGGQGSAFGESVKIHLAEIPAPRIPSPRPSELEYPRQHPTQVPEAVGPPKQPSRFAPIKAWLGQGYFDPAEAFEAEVDWVRFRRSQVFLFFLSVTMPFLMLLVLGFLLGIISSVGAALYSVSTPNSTMEIMVYPIVFVLTHGYWLAYLVLPIGMYFAGWLWAVASAWTLSRGDAALIDFKRALGIFAMLAAMLAPFTMFPFIRFLAMGVILVYLAKHLEDLFDISFWLLLRRGGLVLLGTGFLYGTFERKVESLFPGGEELRANLEGLVRQRRKLDWPSFQASRPIDPNEQLLVDVSSLTPQIREPAVKKSLAILTGGGQTPEFRFRLAKRLADNGLVEAYPFAARFSANGQGGEVNLPAAINWIQKFTEVNPMNLEAGLDKARYLLQAERRLEAKVCLVQLAKTHMDEMSKVTGFIQRENLGKMDQSITWEVQNLYQQGNTTTTSSYSTYSPTTGTRWVSEYQTKQAGLLKKLYVSGGDSGLWFYRALVAEFERSESAGPEIYGEVSTVYQSADLEKKLKEGNAVALDVTADRCLLKGDVAGARENWLAATRVLNDDNRRANVPLYLKLAQSYDPSESTKESDPKLATKFYLATLLITRWTGRMEPIGLGPLERLHQVKIPDPMGQPYLDLCLKHDIPEAWVMMGDRYLNGDFPGVPLNAAKARDCFQKAQALGYKGPQFFKQLALLDATITASNGTRAGHK